MEIYLAAGLAFMYLLTVMLLPARAQKKIWTSAFILAFAIMSVAVFYVKSYADETLMRAGELNWYYILYVFGAISLVLGAINLWIYKKGLIGLFAGDDGEEDDGNGA